MDNQNSSRFETLHIPTYIVIAVLAFSAYTFYTKYHTSEKADDVIFENNLKCSKFIEQETERLKDVNALPAVYYSPVLKTCVSQYIGVDQNGFVSYNIHDILTNDSIYSKGGPSESQLANDAFDGYIIRERELKGTDI
jgi:hypothetical protein